MKIKSFLADNLSFGELHNFNWPIVPLNTVGNFFLLPASHLLNGKSVVCLLVPRDEKMGDTIFSIIEKPASKSLVRVIKLMASLILFLPGIILGTLFKGSTLVFSDRLRRRYAGMEVKLSEQRNYKN